MDSTVAYIIGTLGNLLFGFKSLFQVIQCWRKKSCLGLSKGMLVADFGGNLACAYFIHATTGFKLWPQFVNYGCATLWLIILFVMMFVYDRPKRKGDLIITVNRTCGILPPKEDDND